MPPVPSLAAATDYTASARREADAGRRFGRGGLALGAVAAIELAAIAAQVHFGAVGDVSWMITICEKWLDGGTPYVDFIETNPPASILLYMPAVALSRLIGARPEALVAASGFAAVGAALWLSAAILRRAGLIAQIGPATLGLALVALTILPGRTFDERDFFVTLFALPYLALTAARATHAPVDWRHVGIVGLCAGAMIAIKPPYGLVAVAAAAVLARRAGLATLMRAGEYWLAAALLTLYAAVIVWRFPAYGAEIAPTVLAAYLPVRQSIMELIGNTAVVPWFALAGLLCLLAGPRLRAPLVAMAAAGAIGALAVFFVQGKGWLYQAYPALALGIIALGVALDGEPRAPRRLAAMAGAAGATVAAVLLFGLPPIEGAAVAALGATLMVIAASPRSPDFAAERVMRIGAPAAAAVIAAACLLYRAPINGPDAAFTRAVADLGPHPRLAAIAEGLGIGFPLVRAVDGVWVQRTQGLLMTAGARWQIDKNPGDRALAERLAPIIARDRDMLAEDIRQNRPDGLLVNNVGPRFHQWAMSDPKLAAALAGYRLEVTSDVKNWPVDLYVREDLIGLRPSLSVNDGDVHPVRP
jgi:hypothetical protein